MPNFTIEKRLMGSAFELVIVHDNEDEARQLLNEGITEIQRIEALLTEFKESSQTSLINKNAGTQPVTVDAEVYQILQRSLRISATTQGAFDISAGVLKKLYNFKNEDFVFPDTELVTQTLGKTGYQYIRLLPDNKVYLERAGMHIGFGAIGKGYAADKVKELWINRGVKAGVINASGDLTAWGWQDDGSGWKTGIADPDDSSKILLWLPIENGSVATSGDYEQYFERDGIRYSHNIDPRTGRPVRFIKSVTIVSGSAELCDALATAVTVMGKDVGLDFINQLPNVHCIIIDHNNSIYKSKNIQIHA